VLWSGIGLSFTWGKLLRCKDEDDKRRPVHGSVWQFSGSKYDDGNRRNGCVLALRSLGCRRLPLAGFRCGKTVAGRPNSGDSTQVYMGGLP
jgi:hypothetical protein